MNGRHLIVRRSTALILVAALLVSTVVFLQLSSAPASGQEAETRSVNLAEGWNLVGWTGPTTALDEAITGIVDQVEAIATFNAASQGFATWNAAGPSFLNTLTELMQGEGAWILVGATTVWEQPIVADPGPVNLREGFNLLTWTGPSGLDPTSAFAGLGDDLNAAFAFDPSTGSFSSYGPSRSAFVNDLDPITYGDGFWALTSATTSWTPPAAAAPFSRTLADGSVTLTIPRGALPPDVDAESIQMADITQTPAFAAVAEQATNVIVGLDLQPSGLQFALPVRVTTTVSNPAEPGLFVLLSSGDRFELVTEVTLDGGDADTVTVSAWINHFSLFWVIIAPRLVTAENQDVGAVPVGTRFDAAITVSLDADFDAVVTAFGEDEIVLRGIEDDDFFQVRELRITVDRDGVWGLLDSDPFHVLQGAVSPVGPARMVPGSFTDAFLPIDVLQNYSCDGAGDFVILFISAARVSLAETVGPLHRFWEREPSVTVPDVDAFVRGTCTGLSGTLSFQTFGASGQLVTQIPRSEDFELLIHDENSLPPRFPLTITIRLGGFGLEEVVRTFTLDGDAAVVCSDPNEPNWCSLPIDALGGILGFPRIEITVTDKDGNAIAFAGRGSY